MKLEIKTYYELEYNDLENVIQDFYGIKEYNIPMILETSNDTSHTFSIREKEELDKWELETIQKVRDGKEPSYSLYTVMQDLVNNDILPIGEYLVKISW